MTDHSNARGKRAEEVDNAREQALIIITDVFKKNAYSNLLLKNLGRKFSPLDQAFITELVYGTIKWKLRIDNAINHISNKKIDDISLYALNILRMGIYQIDFMNKVPEFASVNESVKLAKKYENEGAAKFVNAVLRNYLRKHDSVVLPDKRRDCVKYLSVAYSFPEWIVKKLTEEYGMEFTEEFLKCSNDVPSLTARVNTLKTNKENIFKSLADDGIDVLDAKYMKDAFTFKNPSNIGGLRQYKDGLFTIQDESSMLAVKILSPRSGEFIMDVCSAPGTKSTYMAELMDNKGTVISGDIAYNKLGLIDKDAKRLGINIIKTICNDASGVNSRYAGKADRVLVDAPCSGFGIMNKKPEIRWNRTMKDIESIERAQSLILSASSKYVKPKGILVYSTCTVLKSENIDIIDNFLKSNSNFCMEDISYDVPQKLLKPSCRSGYINIYPNTDGIDGFFIAKLRRME